MEQVHFYTATLHYCSVQKPKMDLFQSLCERMRWLWDGSKRQRSNNW